MKIVCSYVCHCDFVIISFWKELLSNKLIFNRLTLRKYSQYRVCKGLSGWWYDRNVSTRIVTHIRFWNFEFIEKRKTKKGIQYVGDKYWYWEVHATSYIYFTWIRAWITQLSISIAQILNRLLFSTTTKSENDLWI